MTADDPYASFLENYQREAAPPKPATAPEMARAGEHRNIWVWIEHVDREVYPASLENLGRAKELADQLGARCAAVLFGHQVGAAAAVLGEYGADHVFLADDATLAEFELDGYRDLLVGLAREHRPEAMLFPATVMGRNLGAQVAAALGTGIVPNCVRIEVDAAERRLQLHQTSFEDRIVSELIIPEARPQISTVTPGSYRRPLRESGRTATVSPVEMKASRVARRVRTGKREPPNPRALANADALVVGGLGLGSRESFRLAEELSLMVGGVVGGTRAAVACGWCDPKILITSAKHDLRPRLYIACGVIGEYDHLKAIEESHQILAITPDPASPICDLADVIGVGDPTLVLESLVETLRKARLDRLLVR